jgi:sRNA-binding protein
MTEEELRERWPAAFNDARCPLQIGINIPMGLDWGDPAMEKWVQHPIYLRNQLKAGAVRINLDGQSVGTVTPAEQCHAWNVLAIWVRTNLMAAQDRGYRSLTTDEKRELRRTVPKKPKDYDRYMFGKR